MLTHEIEYTLVRPSADFDLTIGYEIDDYIPAKTYGLPEDCYPAEGGDVTDLEVTLDGKPFPLDPKEEDLLVEYIQSTHDFE